MYRNQESSTAFEEEPLLDSARCRNEAQKTRKTRERVGKIAIILLHISLCILASVVNYLVKYDDSPYTTKSNRTWYELFLPNTSDCDGNALVCSVHLYEREEVISSVQALVDMYYELPTTSVDRYRHVYVNTEGQICEDELEGCSIARPTFTVTVYDNFPEIYDILTPYRPATSSLPSVSLGPGDDVSPLFSEGFFPEATALRRAV
eukprot:Rmarinus@m.9063